MRNSELRRRWKKSGATYRAVAEEIGRNHTSVREAVLGLSKCPAPDIAQAVAAAVGVPATDIWPACAYSRTARATVRKAA